MQQIRKHRGISLLFALVTALLSGCSGGNDAPEGQSSLELLGSFVAEYRPGHELTYYAVRKPSEEGSAALSLASGSGRLLPGPNFAVESLTVSDGRIQMLNCAPANWNAATGVLSVNGQMHNVSDTVSPYAPTGQVFVPPIYFAITALTDSSGTALTNPVTGVVTEINSNYPGQTCDNPTTLTNCDSSGLTNVFDSIWPDDTASTLDDPAIDQSTNIGPSFRFLPDDMSDCFFLQLKLSAEREIMIWFDVLGTVEDLSFPAPTVASIATPTNDFDPSFVVTLDGSADAVRLIGGLNEEICVNGTSCDLDASSTTITVDYTLNQNVENDVFVYQRVTSPLTESPATVVTIVHDIIPPVFVTSTPASGATNISPVGNVLITFDGDLEVASINTTSIQLHRDGGVGDCSTFGVQEASTVTNPVANQILINPNTALSQTTTYCARVFGLINTPCDGTDELRDAAGNCLAETQVIQFTTSNADNTAPVVVSTLPTDNANGVSINTSIQIIFNEAMDPATTNLAANFIVEENGSTAITGSRSLSPDGKTLTFTPTSPSPLNTSTMYQVTVNTNVTDLAGNNLDSDYIFQFTTGLIADTTPPSIVAFVPSDQATNVNENIRPQITFDEPMDPATITTSNIHLDRKSDRLVIPSTVSLSPDGLTATIVPINPLDNNTLYLISVEFAVTDIAGNSLSSPQTAEFTTQAVADTTPPEIISITPANNSADVSVYSGVVVSFSETMDPNSLHSGTFFLKRTSTGVVVPATVEVSANGLTAILRQISPPITKNVEYTVTLQGAPSTPNAITDVAGNELAADSITTFITEFQDNVAAEVVTVAPPDLDPAVPLNANIVLTFSEPLDDTSITNNTISVVNTNTSLQVTGLLRLLSDGINVRLNPDTDLIAGDPYQIDTTNSVKDLSGRNAIPFTSNFTAGTAADTSGPTFQSSIPADGATNIDRWPSITATFDEVLDPSTVNDSNVELVRDFDSSKIPLTLSISTDARTITINPVNLLPNLETFTANIKTGLRNISGFSLQSFTSFSFTTLDNSSDTQRPYVTATVPADGTNGVPVSQIITITLNEPVDPDRVIPGNVTVAQSSGNNPPPKGDVTVELDGTRQIITITPLTNFQNNKNYEIRMKNLIVDDADNALDCNPGAVTPAAVGSCDTPSNPNDWISSFST